MMGLFPFLYHQAKKSGLMKPAYIAHKAQMRGPVFPGLPVR
jgi:hypothetical protein